MEWERIHKRPDERAGAGLPDYEEYVRTFSWTRARALLDGLPDVPVPSNFTARVVQAEFFS